MNQTFSFSRFGRLLRKYFTDNRGQLLANVALLVVTFLAISFLFYSGFPQDVDRNRQVPLFIIGWAAWYLFIWQQTEVFNQRERAITYLMQPASRLEKITLIWLVSGLGFIIVYLLIFTLLDAIGISFVNSRNWTPEQLKQAGSYRVAPWYRSTDFFKMPSLLIVLSALLHPFALAFLLFFRRYSLPSVAVLAFLLVVGGLFANSAILSSLTGEMVSNAFPFANIQMWSTSRPSRPIDLPLPIGNQIRYAVGISAVVLLYITAWFRLKEREI